MGSLTDTHIPHLSHAGNRGAVRGDLAHVSASISRMADHTMDKIDPLHKSNHDAVWQGHNNRGLDLAALSGWAEAADAFGVAVDSIGMGNASASLQPLALVLSNQAQACFHAGAVGDAIRLGERALAVRNELVGEESVASARTRMDLAVMLAAAGRGDEAMVLVQRSIAAVEQLFGEEDPRLTVVLENAGRIALSAGAIASAEPYLLRLHALLDLYGEDTASADRLLARIIDFRESRNVASSAEEDAPVPSGTQQEITRTDQRSTVWTTPVANPATDDKSDQAAPTSALVNADAEVSERMQSHTEVELEVDGGTATEVEAADDLTDGWPSKESPRVGHANRGVTVVMPTPEAGSRAVETPIRGIRKHSRKASPELRARSWWPWLPVTSGLLVAAAVGWWLLLR